jgi:glycyl-tRNA synthetase beta chain
MRRRHLAEVAEDLADDVGGRPGSDAHLLDTWAHLVETPGLVRGTFDPRYLSLPDEILVTTMREHQKVLPIRGLDGALTPHFLAVCDQTGDPKGLIARGNEWVVNARFADARFFWEQDKKIPLERLLPKLDHITFHARLGTQGERVKRVEALAGDIATAIGADRGRATLAARLAKADLVTGMVGEFPELQGLMGRYYAIAQGSDEEVADAIRDHYKPQGPSDSLPVSKTGQVVAVADKLDTLVGFWAIDEKPTGSKDPYALRRAALGIIRSVLEQGTRLNLAHAIAISCRSFGEFKSIADRQFTDDLLAFFADRLKVYLRDKGARYDLIDAVFALGGQHDLLMMVRRVEALSKFLDSEDGNHLLTGVKRATNILKIEEKKDGRTFDGNVNTNILIQGEERELNTAINGASAQARKAVAAEDFEAAMRAMAKLRGPVDAFFDKVTVNADDPSFRENRLKLLNRIRAATREVADFSKIEG